MKCADDAFDSTLGQSFAMAPFTGRNEIKAAGNRSSDPMFQASMKNWVADKITLIHGYSEQLADITESKGLTEAQIILLAGEKRDLDTPLIRSINNFTKFFWEADNAFKDLKDPKVDQYLDDLKKFNPKKGMPPALLAEECRTAYTAIAALTEILVKGHPQARTQISVANP